MPSNNTGREKTIASNDRRALIPLPLPIAADPFSLVQPELSLARPSSKLCPRAFLSAKLRPDRVIHYGRGGRGGGGEEEVRAADSPTLHKYQFHYSRDVITNHV